MTAPPVKAGGKAMTRVMQMKTKGWLRKVRRRSTVPLEALLLLLLPVLLLDVLLLLLQLLPYFFLWFR